MIYRTHTHTHLGQIAQEGLDVNFISGKVSEYERHTPIVEGTIFFGV
jgi:hypothetical protein